MSNYIELHAHSNYSLLDGATHPEDLVARAAELGMPALALTDHDAVYGAVRFAQVAQAQGITPIFGAELTFTTGHHLTALVENQQGWANLCWLISRARQNVPKGQAALPPTELVDHTEGLIILSGCRQGEIAAALLQKEYETALSTARRYRDWCGPERFWIELQHHLLPEDNRLVEGLVEVARRVGVGYVATNNVHYATPASSQLQDVLVCIRHQTHIYEAGPLLRPNSEYYLKSAGQLAPLFKAYPEALPNTLVIADRCQFQLQYGLQDLPAFPLPADVSAMTYLRQLCQAAISARYSGPPPRVGAQLNHELAIIEHSGLANYFLIVWDIVREANSRNIRCQGRGSAANSLVAYLLSISPIDPLSHDLVFERFLSAERQTPPDIDLDFEADKRDQIIQYVYGKYGQDYAAMACTFVCFHQRSAWRDVGKALGLSASLLSQASLIGSNTTPDSTQAEDSPQEKPTPALLETVQDLCRQLHQVPRHLGLHNGGMVLINDPLAHRLPTEKAAMPGRTVVQWDKDSLEAAGLIKIDLLGLRMLSAITEAVTLIGELRGQAAELDRLTFDDPQVYNLVARGDTIGVFQVESRAQAQLAPRLKARCFNDLVVSTSLIRPGPVQGNMVRPYLERRLGLAPVTYLHPKLEPALAETLGVILYQEQVLKVARDLAGFSAGLGEQLRRALGNKRGEAEIERFRAAFLAGAEANGVSTVVAEAIFEQLKAFGSYSFAKSHAASFAVLIYQSAWLKYYYPAQFYVGLLNNQPMGFWTPSVILGDARRHGMMVLPVDLNGSQARCTVEPEGIRLGFNYIDGLGEVNSARLIEARQTGAFTNLANFCQRTRLSRRVVENLILAGAGDGWGIPRRRLLWELPHIRYEEELDLVFPPDGVELPPLSEAEKLLMEYKVTGLFTGQHIMTLYRPWLMKRGILSSWELATQPDGQRVWIAGLLVVHQAPPTAKGFHFLALEDEGALIDVIVQPKVYSQYRQILQTASLLVVEGTVQNEDGVVNLLASHIAILPQPRLTMGEYGQGLLALDTEKDSQL